MTRMKEPDDGSASVARIRDSRDMAGSDARQAELEALVAARTAELSALAMDLQNALELERSALARELHDELGGLITAAKMDMAWLTSHVGDSLDAAGAEKFKSVVQMLNQAMTLKRRVVENLRPSLLDHFGLTVALRSHFDENCASSGLECVSTLPEEALDVAPSTQLTLFRVAQEALANILSRGSAKHVELVIEEEGDGYVMIVGDDGAEMGANLSRAMAGIRHRVQSTGGKLAAETVPGLGNRVRAYVPRSPAKSG
jgi:signal transduction histidine kinase